MIDIHNTQEPVGSLFFLFFLKIYFLLNIFIFIFV